MSAEAWAASYRSWNEVYDNPTDVARAVVREQIARIMTRQDEVELSTDHQSGV
jgi:hypothetical protein